MSVFRFRQEYLSAAEKKAKRSKLEPCIFCGTKRLQLATAHMKRIRIDALWHYVECPGCGAEGPKKRTETRAIDAWNTRIYPNPQTILERVEESLT